MSKLYPAGIIFVILCFLASACSPITNLSTNPSAASTAPVVQALPSATVVVNTATPQPTSAPSSTAEPVISAGIPASIEKCNHISIFAASGMIDSTLIETQMQKLVAAEKAYIQQKGLGAGDISEIVSYSPQSESGKLPYPYARAEGRLYPVSCSLVDANDGSWRLMVGVMIKQNIQATNVSVAHFLLDHPGLEKYLKADGEQSDYTEKYSPEATFNQLLTGPHWYFSVRPWIPDPNADQQFFPDWRVSHELMVLNQDAPVALNQYLAGTKLDPAVENSYVPRLEKMIFPTMWLWVTAVP